mmetsp:Transcript_18248/g.37632  ORF Transcript_18248/g.37632 Transcript_18248/m.37632 type:complete len:240 (+) Transcript_18248:305-1024(+)
MIMTMTMIMIVVESPGDASHRIGVSSHDTQVGTDCLGEIDLVDDEQIRLGDSRSTLSGNLVSPGHINNIQGKIRQFVGKIRRQIVPTRFAENQRRRRRIQGFGKFLAGRQIGRDVLPNGSVGASARLNCLDVFRGQDVLFLPQKLGILLGKNIVGHHRQRRIVCFRGKSFDEGQDERGLSRAHGTTDSHRKSAFVPCLKALGMAFGCGFVRKGKSPGAVGVRIVRSLCDTGKNICIIFN